MNEAALILWLTLNNPAFESEATLTALAMKQLAIPGLDPEFVFENRPLILLACKRCPVFRESEASPGLPAVVEPITRLLALGANPWIPITQDTHVPQNRINVISQLGVLPFLELLRAKAWPLMDRFLEHPSRPAWSALLADMKYSENKMINALDGFPQALPLFLKHGLDPNLDIGGQPLIFHVKNVDTAQRLVEAGADVTRVSSDGLSLFAHREKQATDRHRPLGADERAQWARLMGRDRLQPSEVFRAALSGSVSKIKPLFKTVRELKEWAWSPDQGRPLNVLDGALYGQFHTSGAGPSAANLFLKSKSNPNPISQDQEDLAWLLSCATTKLDHHDSQVIDRLNRALRTWLKLDRRLLDQGVLSGLNEYSSKMQTLFLNCLPPAPESAQTEALLDRWMEWYVNAPQRWAQGSSVVDQPMCWPATRWAARHQVVWWAQHMKKDLAAYDVTRRKTNIASFHATASEKVLASFERLMTAHQRAGASFPENGWKAIWEHFGAHPHLGPDLDARRLACQREQKASEQMPSPRRARPRA